ncbi:MAG: UDP-N-acetylmuramoyl-tripeptide--D-alanyl-D-alanine ligase [Rickettsiales bacterium]|nr:UDP-N-acetylmuramoyl-tripeptide--D-alanyl-D-alanine ligase [Rickettsiales bacterium]
MKFIFNHIRFIDKKLTIFVIVFHLLNAVVFVPIALIIFTMKDFFYVKNAKKKMVFTARVKRIFSVALFLVISLICVLYRYPLLVVLATIHFVPFSLILSNLLLSPYENYTQNKFLKEASSKLHKINPIVIGVTGSMGKTSTKHILAHILSTNLSVLFTPGSINTKMGITRIIREKLSQEHKYFVVEMGAYFKGSIKKLCDFVEPKYGIITAIGDSHYEFFKSREAVASTKFELGECVTKNDGFLIINNNIEDNLIPDNINLIKIGDISNITQKQDGLHFTYKNEEVFAPIFGEHQATNIVLAIEIAIKLGMPFKTILVSLNTLPQITHRLEVKNQGDNIIIDDAYNSNFEGFKSGLNLLQVFDNKKKVLITPGMVELGTKHDELHYEIGKIAAEKTDVTVLVKSSRIPTFVKGFKETNKNSQLVEVDSFAKAQEWMSNNLHNSAILLENDLPDVFESSLSL